MKLRERWDAFWFGPLPAEQLALCRIALGLVVFGMMAEQGPDLFELFSTDGFEALSEDPLHVLTPRLAPMWANAAYFGLMGALVATIVGYRARLFGFLAAFGFMYLAVAEEVNLAGYDQVILWMLWILTLAPTGAALSIDAYRRRPRTVAWVPHWPRRMTLFLFTFAYVFAGLAKFNGGMMWFRGDTMRYLMVHLYSGGKPIGAWVSGQGWLVALMACTAVVFETSGVLLWWKRANPWYLALGVGFHIGVEAVYNVSWFGGVMLACYPLLLHPDHYATARAWVLARVRR